MKSSAGALCFDYTFILHGSRGMGLTATVEVAFWPDITRPRQRFHPTSPSCMLRRRGRGRLEMEEPPDLGRAVLGRSNQKNHSI